MDNNKIKAVDKSIERFENDENYIDTLQKIPRRKTFKEDCLEGRIPFSKVTEYVKKWEKNHEGLILKDYLGLSDEEYNDFERGTLERKWKEKSFKSTAILRKALERVLGK